MKWAILLLLIPAVPIGVLFGWIFFAALPAIVFDIVWQGSRGDLDLIQNLSRIAGITGGCLGAVVVFGIFALAMTE